MSQTIRILFLDIGGVLLSNGWDGSSRREAAGKFGIDFEEMERRHQLFAAILEEGGISLDEYLKRVIFFHERDFSEDEFRQFMFSRSWPHPEAIDFMRELKSRHAIRVAAINNESRELARHRIDSFGLALLFDFFVTSCYAGIRKPDERIYRLALDLACVEPGEAVYIDDRPALAEVAGRLGINAIVHESLAQTRSALTTLGLS